MIATLFLALAGLAGALATAAAIDVRSPSQDAGGLSCPAHLR
jgi:hypothetical protein